MKQVDTAQCEARAREVRHAVVASLTAGTHRTFRVLFAIQWPILPPDGVLVMLVCSREQRNV